MREISYKTKNGINIYGIKNPAQHGFYISLFLRAGIMYEAADEVGITHFLEHILIRNVNRVMNGRLYETCDRYGIEFNASTYAEMVQFYVVGARQNVGIGIDIITRLFEEIMLTGQDVDAERQRIKAEIRESGDKTSLAAFSSAAVHSGTPLSRQITGSIGDVNRISKAMLEKYRRDSFTPENIFFYLTGGFEDKDVELLSEAVDKYELKSSSPKQNIAPLSKNAFNRECRVHIKNAAFTALRMTFDLDMTKISLPESDLLYDTLISGYNSELFVEMSEKRGLFYDISGSLERYNNIGTLTFGYELRADKLYEAIEATVGILNKIKRELTEGSCMKAGYVDNALMLYDDMRELNFTFAYDNKILGAGYGGVRDRQNAYEKVTPERLSQVAREVFQTKNLTLTMKGSKKKTDEGRIVGILRALDEA